MGLIYLQGSKKTENKTFPGNSTPWSTGPRTVSILTALNELSISDKVEKSSSTSSCRTDQLLGRITNGDATKQRKCLVPETKYFSTLRNDLTFSESTIRGESRLLPQIPREQGNYREGNERLKSESTQPPEWIQKIFQLTKFGRLDKLVGWVNNTFSREKSWFTGFFLVESGERRETLNYGREFIC